MTQPPAYYTDDITLLPLGAIWRAVRRVTLLLCVPVFLYLAFRKVLGLRLAANFASPRPGVLPTIEQQHVPDQVIAELAPLVEACTSAGFVYVCHIRPNTIGAKRAFSSLLLHTSGTVSASATWIQISVGALTKKNIAFACHSITDSDVDLTTGPLSDQDWNPEFLPPYVQFDRLPIETAPADVIRRHNQRVSSRTDMVAFDHQSIQDYVLASTQRLFDHLIEKGLYAQVTPAEVQRLMQQSEPVAAEVL